MKHFLILLLTVTGTSLAAQTKEIAFKSHSGTMANFKAAMEHDFFGSDRSDFGEAYNPIPPPRFVGIRIPNYRCLDSVIYISNSQAILIVGEYILDNRSNDSIRLDFLQRDTVYFSLFSRKHSLDSIKKELKEKRWYNRHPLKETVFIGYDNKKPKSQEKSKEKKKTGEEQQNMVSFVIPDQHDDGNSPFQGQVGWMLGAILFFSLTGGWISWKLYRPKLQAVEGA